MKNLYFLLLLIIIIGCSKDTGNRIVNKNVENNKLNTLNVYTENKDCYCFIDDWYGNTGKEIFIGGKIIVEIVLLDFIDNNKIKLEIFKQMTGFGQMILEKTIAEKIEERYEFEFIDGWNNKAYGNFIFNDDDTITFYLDCKEFSDDGKMIGRLYGDTYILKKGEININWVP